MISIADNLSLPLDAVTQTFAVLAKRRAGKSYTARRFAEQLLSSRQQVVIVDPKGDWWGIRSSADGKRAGFPVIVLGGEHADLPLEVGAGEVVAKLAVYERVNVLIDLSGLRKNEVARFMGGELQRQGFLESIYRLKAKEEYRGPLMLIVDEADAIAPQKPYKGEERMLGAIEDIVRRGGQRGIGCLLVSQRSAVLNKNVLTQTQILVAMRTIAPQDLDAMNAWVDVHGTPEQRKTLMGSLPSLPTGDAWFWSPGWPGDDGIFKRVHVAPISTFDSGATPKAGERPAGPKTLAEIDLEAVRRQMAETIERAKADDPRELKRQIAELQGRLANARAPVSDEEIEKAHAVAHLTGWNAGYARGQSDEYERIRGVIDLAMVPPIAGSPRIPFVPTVPPELKRGNPRIAPRKPTTDNGRSSADLGEGGLRRMLIALAQRRQGLSAKQLGVRAGLSSSSGTFGVYLGKGRSSGWIEGNRDHLRITDAGLKALGGYEPLPEGRELLEYWLRELGQSGAARMLEVLSRTRRAMTADELGGHAGLAADSGTFGVYLGKLRTLELITGSRSELRISEELL